VNACASAPFRYEARSGAIPGKVCPRLGPMGGLRFSEKDMLKQKLERNPALAPGDAKISRAKGFA
jgi:hypothetical protein